ncbi:nicotinate-nucleotide adenylyltransferase [Rossellomorea marisflavi]|uniref:nicotinate-nucleotide adenylyltransferase n=1 Tax=Rossellomorea marisflavi TaxID=189381 RepID=UPI0011534F0D
MNMKIGILGGTFNPPHMGHLIVAEQVRDQAGLDEVWFMPNAVPPHKVMESNVTAIQRVTMIKEAIKGHPHFRVESIELEREGPSYTYETMRLLREKYPHHKFSFIIGGDMVEYLPNWKEIDELLSTITFIGVNRPQYSTDSPYEITSLDIPAIDISSSTIRNLAKEKRSFRYLVPDDVYRLIKGEKLYE